MCCTPTIVDSYDECTIKSDGNGGLINQVVRPTSMNKLRVCSRYSSHLLRGLCISTLIFRLVTCWVEGPCTPTVNKILSILKCVRHDLVSVVQLHSVQMLCSNHSPQSSDGRVFSSSGLTHTPTPHKHHTNFGNPQAEDFFYLIHHH